MTATPAFAETMRARSADVAAVAEHLGVTAAPTSLVSTRAQEPLVDAAAVAAHLGTSRGYVYSHALELGARRLGSGPKARLRFSLAEVDERLSACSAGSGSESLKPAPTKGLRPRRGSSMGTNVELLPIRGRYPGSNDVRRAS